MQIVIFLFDQVTALDAVGPYEVLSRRSGTCSTTRSASGCVPSTRSRCSPPSPPTSTRWMGSRGGLIIGSSLKSLRRAGVQIKSRVLSTSANGVTFADGSGVAPTSVIWATGFRSDYSWIQIPGVLADGPVVHRRELQLR